MATLHRPRPLVGISLKILATMTIVATGALIKVAADYPIGQIVFMRGLFGFIPLLIWVAAIGKLGTFYKTTRIGAQIGRSVIGITSMALQFSAYAMLPLSDATALVHSSPLFLVILAAVLLGENVRFVRWAAVAAGMCGVLLIVYNYVGFQHPDQLQGSAIGVFYGLGAAFLVACAAATIRTLTKVESVETIVFYFTLFTVLTSALTLPFAWVTPSLTDFLALAGVGVAAGAGQVFMTMSLRYADASLLAPFSYLALVWALVVGWLVFDQLPDTLVVIGAVIVTGAGLVVAYRERQARREAAKAALEKVASVG